MNKPSVAAAPDTGTSDLPTRADLEADPEIAALLDFQPVPRQAPKANGWTPAAQRIFIAWLAHHGSPTRACDEVGKARSGIDKLYKAADAEDFRASWDGAVALFEQRRIAQMASRPGGHGALRAPTPARGRSRRPAPYTAPLAPGEVYNEHGLPEDEAAFNRRGEEARESIGTKLLRCRRALLAEISRDPGKRAAFELLTELPIDWDKARRLEAQDDEPWRTPRMLEADMVVTAETGWFGTMVPDYGPDKIGPLREAINRARAEREQRAIECWDVETPESGADAPPPPLPEPEVPVTEDAPIGPPPMRSFGLNSQEFYDVVAKPGRRARIPRRD